MNCFSHSFPLASESLKELVTFHYSIIKECIHITNNTHHSASIEVAVFPDIALAWQLKTTAKMTVGDPV